MNDWSFVCIDIQKNRGLHTYAKSILMGSSIDSVSKLISYFAFGYTINVNAHNTKAHQKSIYMWVCGWEACVTVLF